MKFTFLKRAQIKTIDESLFWFTHSFFGSFISTIIIYTHVNFALVFDFIFLFLLFLLSMLHFFCRVCAFGRFHYYCDVCIRGELIWKSQPICILPMWISVVFVKRNIKQIYNGKNPGERAHENAACKEQNTNLKPKQKTFYGKNVQFSICLHSAYT